MSTYSFGFFEPATSTVSCQRASRIFKPCFSQFCAGWPMSGNIVMFARPPAKWSVDRVCVGLVVSMCQRKKKPTAPGPFHSRTVLLWVSLPWNPIPKILPGRGSAQKALLLLSSSRLWSCQSCSATGLMSASMAAMSSCLKTQCARSGQHKMPLCCGQALGRKLNLQDSKQTESWGKVRRRKANPRKAARKIRNKIRKKQDKTVDGEKDN